MFYKLSTEKSVKEILIVSLTNIGDVIAVAPSMDVVLNDFPQANVSVIVGPKGRSLFDQNPHLKRVFVYDKHASNHEKLAWVQGLRSVRYDAVIDFRNSFLPFLLQTKTRTPPQMGNSKNLHLVDKHLLRLKTIYPFSKRPDLRKSIAILPKDRDYVDALLRGYIKPGDQFVLIAPVAQDSAKTWNTLNFAQVCDGLIDRYGLKVVMVGSDENKSTMDEIQSQMKRSFLALPGQTDLIQVAEILNRALFSIVHDSGIMHMASYFDRQVLALFGKTDPRLSGPWSKGSGYIWKNQSCQRCVSRDQKYKHSCMSAITHEDVLNSIVVQDKSVLIKTIHQPCENFKMS
ncbi:MAG: glycosyltransferase family 9 protein [Candidatus Omnitrophica bacterium]|nr:glycosyltransferase family 9 protein [Candidatus Omnitrophota bacterium]